MGVIPDWRLSLTSDLKQAGNLLYLVGNFAPRFGGSHHNLINAMPEIEEGMPVCHPETPDVYRKVFQSNQAGWIQSAHDLSEGGLGVAAAEMAISGRLGLRLWLDEFHAYREAFGETGGCILLEVAKQDQVAFETHFGSKPMRLIGKVLSDQFIEIMNGEYCWLKMRIEDLVQAWKNQQIREVQA
jgi:phosphoribosylformylglycinamidine synthase